MPNGLIRVINSTKDRTRKFFSEERSKKSFIGIVSSFGAKFISIVIQLLIVPLTINYLNPTRYGIWLALSSVIGWISFFDLGLGNGLRNRFAEAKADGNPTLAKQYVSTAYITVGSIVVILLFCLQIINHFISWPSILNVGAEYEVELRKIFSILSFFFSANLVLRLVTSILTADQKPGEAAWIGVLGQLLSLGVMFVLVKTTEGSLVRLASYYSGIPTIVLLICSIIVFKDTKYKQVAPSFRSFRKDLINNILNLGIKFFVIYLCIIIIFQLINIVISREIGPEAVTQYNIAYKYYSVIYSVLMIIVTPFWSAFTDAFHKRDLQWMKKSKRLLELIWLLFCVVLLFMVCFSHKLIELWVGDDVYISNILSVAMACFIASQCLSAIYMNLINGIGFVQLQLLVYLVSAILSWPLMVLCIRRFGLAGVLIIPTTVYLLLSLVCKIQVEKVLCGRSSGIWAR